MHHSPRSLFATALVLACAGLACHYDEDAPALNPPLILQILEGNAQSVTVGEYAPVSPAVRVTSGDNVAVPHVLVSFVVLSTRGQVVGADQYTGEDGIARVDGWLIGAITGLNTVNATVQHAWPTTVAFTAIGVAGPPKNLAKMTGEPTIGTAGAAVGTRPSVKVTDVFGNGVSGVTVTFAVTSGGGSLTEASQLTNETGIATVGGWILGPGIGPNTMTATVAAAGVAASVVTFSVTGNPPY
jgi:hypothetical protein